MEGFIPFDKMSKRKKREQLAKRRKTWEGLNPVTRKPDNPKAYKRSADKSDRARQWKDDSSTGAP